MMMMINEENKNKRVNNRKRRKTCRKRKRIQREGVEGDMLDFFLSAPGHSISPKYQLMRIYGIIIK